MKFKEYKLIKTVYLSEIISKRKLTGKMIPEGEALLSWPASNHCANQN